MSSKKVTIILGAVDNTKAAFKSADGGVKSLTMSTAALTTGLVAMATAAVASAARSANAYIDLAQEMAKKGDDFAKMSDRVGDTAESLSELAYSAQLGGSQIDDVEKGLKRLSTTMLDARDGVADATRNFGALGINVNDANGELRPVTEVFIEMSDKLNALSSDTERTALAQKLLGKSGTNLLPMMKQGSRAIQEQAAQLRALGGIIDTDFADSSAEFVDASLRMETAWGGFQRELSRPVIKSATKQIDDLAYALAQLARESQDNGTSKIIGALPELVTALVLGNPQLRDLGLTLGWINNKVDELAQKSRELEQQGSAYVFGSESGPMSAPLLPGLEPDELDAERKRIADFYADIEKIRLRAIGNMGKDPEIVADPYTYEEPIEDTLLSDAGDEFAALTDGEMTDLMIALDKMGSDLDTVGAKGVSAADQIGESFKNAFVDAGIQMALFEADAEQIFKQLLAMALRFAVGGLFANGGKVEATPMAQGGAIPHAQFGFAVPDGPRGFDSIPILAQPGEHVIDRQLSMSLARFLKAEASSPPPSSGGGGGMVVQFPAWPTSRPDQAVMERGIKNVQRNLDRSVL